MTRKLLPSFLFSMDMVPNVAAANNYVSLFNPSGSGKVVALASLFISSTLFTSSSIPNSLRGYRISTASGGSLVTNSTDIASIQGHLTGADSAVQIRTGNPTCTLGPALFNSPSPIQDKAAPVHDVDLPPTAPPFTLFPGQGVVLRSTAGIGASAYWNITIAWAEGP